MTAKDKHSSLLSPFIDTIEKQSKNLDIRLFKKPFYLSLTEYKNKLERLSPVSQVPPSWVSYWPYRKYYTGKALKGRQTL